MEQLYYKREADNFVKQVRTSMADQLRIPVACQSLNAESIDKLVELETHRLRASYVSEEAQYVELMLRENPVHVQRRPCTTPRGSGISTPPAEEHQIKMEIKTSASTSTDSKRSQMAESCRRSRMNGKIKKATIKYRRDFMKGKKQKNEMVLKCIRDLIEQTEKQLLQRGYRQDSLLRLQQIYKFNKSEPILQMTT